MTDFKWDQDEERDLEFWAFIWRAGGVLLAMLLALAVIALLLTLWSCATTSETRHEPTVTTVEPTRITHYASDGTVAGTDIIEQGVTTTQVGASTTTGTVKPPIPGPGTVKVIGGLLGLPPGVTEGLTGLAAVILGIYAKKQAQAKNAVTDAYVATVGELATNGNREQVLEVAARHQGDKGTPVRETVRKRLRARPAA